MAVNSSALQAVEWCNPGTSCYGFCCCIAIIASGNGRQMVKWSMVCACGGSLAGGLYMRVVCGCTHAITTYVVLTRLYGGALHYI